MIDTAEALTAFAAGLPATATLSLDTEFMREKTYRAELCLLQIGVGTEAVCVDPLAVPDLTPLAAAFTARGSVKIMHAARQDLEVLLPAVGLVAPIFDTQIAAALAGFPAQVGYAELARRLLNVELSKAHTRTDWARRPLSPEQQEYALDDVRHLGALRDKLLELIEARGRGAWLAEELAALEDPAALRVEPDDAWRKIKGLPSLDAERQALAQQLAAWRERRAIERNRPRGWIIDDAVLREILVRAPRTEADLAAIPEMQESVVRKCGEELLAIVNAAGISDPPPALPRRARPDADEVNRVKRLAAIVAEAAQRLELPAEILATRRELERLAAGKRDVSVLSGWRAEVIGAGLLAAL
jgi:ribonuclease D